MRRTEEPPGVEFVLLSWEEPSWSWLSQILCKCTELPTVLLRALHGIYCFLNTLSFLDFCLVSNPSAFPSSPVHFHFSSSKWHFLPDQRSWWVRQSLSSRQVLVTRILWPLPTSKNQRSWPIVWVIARLFSRTGCCWPNNQLLEVHVFPGEGSSFKAHT